MNKENLRKIICRGNLYFDEPLSRHTSFRVGGPAGLFAEPFTEDELILLLNYLKRNRIPWVIIGNGSNLLVSDQGYKGAVIHLGRVDGSDFVMLGYEDKGDYLEFDAGCGCAMGVLGTIAQNFSCTGFEPLSGIPGCLGGALCMNAGAYGAEIGQLISTVHILTENGEVKDLERRQLSFRYRGSSLEDQKAVVLRASYILPKGDKETISALMKEYTQRRKEKQPLEYPSAGSTFKRPAGYFAGKLIEDSGLKGFQLGGACVSEKHAGFIINKEQASAQDIYSLICLVQKRVFENTGVLLEPEVKFIGEFSDEH